jgi:hypothetical protein
MKYVLLVIFVFCSSTFADDQAAVKIWGTLAKIDPTTYKPNAEIKKLLGKSISIAGYMIVNEFESGEVTEFLLARTPAGCIHVPPPPPNSVIHVTFVKGKSTKYFTSPVVVAGVLTLGGRVDSAYEISADSINEFKSK